MIHILSYKRFIRLFTAGAMLLAALGFTTPVFAQSNCGLTYIVQRGDYLAKIARNCNVSYSDLLKANPSIVNPNRIYPGQALQMPAAGIPVTGGIPGIYVVKKGDTLYSISQNSGLSVTDLREANPGISNTIEIGQVLYIPARISFAVEGTSAILQGHLDSSSQHRYLLNAGLNQTLEVNLSGPAGVKLAIMGADGATIQAASSTLSFRGVMPKTQDYVLVVTSDGAAGDYSLSLAVPQRINFSSGATTATITGTVPANLSQFFILRAGKDQTLSVNVSPQDQFQLSIYGVDGTVLRSGMGEGSTFTGVLPSSQDYILVLKTANQARSFNMTLGIPAIGSIPVTGTNSYTVQAGDTLFKIASRNQTTVTVLLRANPEIANRNVIAVGQIIYLPGATITLSNGQKAYVVRYGDTLGNIARQIGATLDELLDANPQITNVNLIHPGQRILLPR